MKLSPDGLSLAIGDRHGNIRIFNMEHFKQIAIVEAHDSEVLSVDYSRASDFGELTCARTGSNIDVLQRSFQVSPFWRRAAVIVSFTYSMLAKIINSLQHSTIIQRRSLLFVLLTRRSRPISSWCRAVLINR